MERLTIKGAHDVFFIPAVDFDPVSGICEIGGESYLEDTAKFYAPILEWLKEYVTQVKQKVVFNFRLTYFNTSSSRSILDILNIIKSYEEEGGVVFVNWYYDEDDIDMEEEIEDYKVESELEIQLIPVEKDNLSADE